MEFWRDFASATPQVFRSPESQLIFFFKLKKFFSTPTGIGKPKCMVIMSIKAFTKLKAGASVNGVLKKG